MSDYYSIDPLLGSIEDLEELIRDVVESLNYYQIMTEQGKTEEEALEVLRARSRDNGRTPMQWTGEYKILLGNYDSPLMRRGSITLRPYETAAFEIADR